MTTTARLTATRTKKARGEAMCPLCGTLILIGQQIGLVTGRGWCHCACITRRQPMIGPATGA